MISSSMSSWSSPANEHDVKLSQHQSLQLPNNFVFRAAVVAENHENYQGNERKNVLCDNVFQSFKQRRQITLGYVMRAYSMVPVTSV